MTACRAGSARGPPARCRSWSWRLARPGRRGGERDAGRPGDHSATAARCPAQQRCPARPARSVCLACPAPPAGTRSRYGITASLTTPPGTPRSSRRAAPAPGRSAGPTRAAAASRSPCGGTADVAALAAAGPAGRLHRRRERAVSRDIWAVSYAGGYVVHWNGAGWRVAKCWRQHGVLSGVTALSPADVWVFGTTAGGFRGLGTWHFNGRTWAGPEAWPTRSTGPARCRPRHLGGGGEPARRLRRALRRPRLAARPDRATAGRVSWTTCLRSRGGTYGPSGTCGRGTARDGCSSRTSTAGGGSGQ